MSKVIKRHLNEIDREVEKLERQIVEWQALAEERQSLLRGRDERIRKLRAYQDNLNERITELEAALRYLASDVSAYEGGSAAQAYAKKALKEPE